MPSGPPSVTRWTRACGRGTIEKIATLKLAPRVLYERLPWAELEGAVRQAVLLTWAETPRDGIPPAIRAGVLKDARQSFLDDRDPGVHSAAELLIRRWKPDRCRWSPLARASSRAPAPGGGAGSRDPTGTHWSSSAARSRSAWGRPRVSRGDITYETQHERRIDRSLLVATTETTVEQYREFNRDHEPDPRYCDKGHWSPNDPVGGVYVVQGHRLLQLAEPESRARTVLPGGGQARHAAPERGP